MEIIVVDDASTDNSIDIIEELCYKYNDILKIKKIKKNGGPARARNKGAHLANGDYYFFIDSDTIMLKSTLTNFIRRIHNADAVTGIYHWKPMNNSFVAWYKALLTHSLFIREGVFEHDVFNSAVAGIRANIFDKSGGFCEDLVWGMDYENEEFGYRLCIDHRILFDPSVCVQHNFPGFIKMTKNYFHRVSLWMELFMIRRKFESGGLATGGMGLATLGAPLTIMTLPLMLLTHQALMVPFFFMFIYLYGYQQFFSIIVKKKPFFLPISILFGFYFSSVITLGAFYGVVKTITGLSIVKSVTNWEY
jgi:glycosyltransferase involved in cell wall biosynthesis